MLSTVHTIVDSYSRLTLEYLSRKLYNRLVGIGVVGVLLIAVFYCIVPPVLVALLRISSLHIW